MVCDDPLRLRGRAARVEQVEQVLGVHRLARDTTPGSSASSATSSCHQRSRPSVHRDVAAGAAQDDRVLHARRVGERLVGVRLSGTVAAVAQALVLGDQHLAAHVVQAVRERVGREAAEDDRVRRAEPRAGEHRDRQPRGPSPGRSRPACPSATPSRLSAFARRTTSRLEVGEGERPALVLRLALPVVGDLVAVAGLDVPVDAVVGDVQLAAEVPLRVRRLPLAELRERLEPGDPLAALRRPELLEVALVDLRLRVRLRGELRRRRVAPLLEEDRLDRVRHQGSRSYGYSVSTSAPSSVTSTRSSSRQPP